MNVYVCVYVASGSMWEYVGASKVITFPSPVCGCGQDA